MTDETLTERQRSYLEAIQTFRKTRGIPPTYQELAEMMRVNVNAARQAVMRLEDAGVLSRIPGIARGIILR